MHQPTLLPRLLGSLTVALSLLLGSSLAAQETPKAPDAAKAPLPGMGITKGPFVPGIQPEKLWDGRKIVAFHALDLPKMVKASEAADIMEPSDYVLESYRGLFAAACAERGIPAGDMLFDRV